MLAKRIEYNNKIYFQSFSGHIEDGLKILRGYCETKRNIITEFCNRWEISAELFLTDIFLTVTLHDIGKLTNEFQQNILLGKKTSRHPHSLFGIPILLQIPFSERLAPIPILCILGHHSQLHKSIYNGYNIDNRVTYRDTEILEFINQGISGLYKELNFEKFFNLPVISIASFDRWSGIQIREKFIEKYLRNVEERYKTKAIYTYILSILQLCDDYSSANFRLFIEKNRPEKESLDSVLNNPSDYVLDLSVTSAEFQRRVFVNFKPHPFQENLGKSKNKFCFLFAPCGRGKTEAALSWAFTQKEKSNREKIIFALPTQVTCNSMFERLINKYRFGRENIGLFHGKSFISLKYFDDENNDKNEESELKGYDALKDEVFKGNVFFKPVTVTTIDHLAYSFVHGFSQADFACGNLQNSIIIFDEVHYYELHTLNILLRLFQILRKLHIPHLLMTGTAPDFLLKEMTKLNYHYIEDKEGLSFQQFRIIKSNDTEDMDNVYQSVMADYKHGKTIFVILNQVKWAQTFYSKLREMLSEENPNVLLYHSKFIYRDRVNKEKEIYRRTNSKPCILITTQVIEISLDISCDVMYTNIAPPDAIGQRGGRLNRSGRTYRNGIEYELKLFSVKKCLPYPEDIIEKSFNQFSDGIYSYRKIKKICDAVYNNIELKNDKRYFDFFKENILFGNHHKDVAYGDDEGKSLKIRESDFQEIDIVPSRVFEEAQENYLIGKTRWEEYEMKIPYYHFRNNINGSNDIFQMHTFGNRNILECNYDYSYEFGIDYTKFFQRFCIL